MNRYKYIKSLLAELEQLPQSYRNTRLNAAIGALEQAVQHIDEQNAKIEALLAVLCKITN